MNKSLSNCCLSSVRIGSGDDGTNWHECTKCGKPCDAVGRLNSLTTKKLMTAEELANSLCKIAHKGLCQDCVKIKDALLSFAAQESGPLVEALEKIANYYPKKIDAWELMQYRVWAADCLAFYRLKYPKEQS